MRSGASGGVFYLGLALIGVLAIPAAVLLGLIAGVWTLTDKLTALLEKSIDAVSKFGYAKGKDRGAPGWRTPGTEGPL